MKIKQKVLFSTFFTWLQSDAIQKSHVQINPPFVRQRYNTFYFFQNLSLTLHLQDK